MNCGTCMQVCPGPAFSGNPGAVTYEGLSMPITLRQSDRVCGARLYTELKERILDGTFNSPLGRSIYFEWRLHTLIPVVRVSGRGPLHFGQSGLLVTEYPEPDEPFN